MLKLKEAFQLILEWNLEFYNELNRTPIVTLALAGDDLGGYDDVQKFIAIAPYFTDAATLASVLIHEGTHAWDDRLGRLDPIIHAPTEQRAHEEQAKFCLWHIRHGGIFTGPESKTMYRLAFLYDTNGKIDVCKDVNPLYCLEDEDRMRAEGVTT